MLRRQKKPRKLAAGATQETREKQAASDEARETREMQRAAEHKAREEREAIVANIANLKQELGEISNEAMEKQLTRKFPHVEELINNHMALLTASINAGKFNPMDPSRRGKKINKHS